MKMYRVSSWSNEIEVLEVVKRTEKTVWMKYENSDQMFQERLNGDSKKWFDTFDEAKEYLINRINNRMESINKELDKLFTIKAFVMALVEVKDEKA